MRDIKTERKLFGPHWNSCAAAVRIAGDPQAGSDDSKWQYAVLEVRPLGALFHVGWRSKPEELPEFLDVPVETDIEGQFGMKVGPGDVEFVVVPDDFQTILLLKHVENVDRDDPHFKDTPGY